MINNNDKIEKRYVITGIEEWWKTEILNWLVAWDKVVVSDFTISTSSKETWKKSSIIPIPSKRMWWNQNFKK